MNARFDEQTNKRRDMMEEATTDLAQAKAVLETALLTSQEPMSVGELRKLFDEAIAPDVLRGLLEEIRAEWVNRGIELSQVASGWRFRAKPEMQSFLDRLSPPKPPKYSRAVLETLAIIAYRQPVTRGDIEDVRGVTVSTNIVKALEARGWIEVIGHREVPGRPALYATTRQFLDDLNLRSIDELPPLEDLGSLVDASEPSVEAEKEISARQQKLFESDVPRPPGRDRLASPAPDARTEPDVGRHADAAMVEQAMSESIPEAEMRN